MSVFNKVLFAIGAFGFVASAAPAPTEEPGKAPVKLEAKDLAEITAGKITKVNGGGNTPNGQANGIPSKNPAGKAPPGHN